MPQLTDPRSMIPRWPGATRWGTSKLTGPLEGRRVTRTIIPATVPRVKVATCVCNKTLFKCTGNELEFGAFSICRNWPARQTSYLEWVIWKVLFYKRVSHLNIPKMVSITLKNFEGLAYSQTSSGRPVLTKMESVVRLIWVFLQSKHLISSRSLFLKRPCLISGTSRSNASDNSSSTHPLGHNKVGVFSTSSVQGSDSALLPGIWRPSDFYLTVLSLLLSDILIRKQDKLVINYVKLGHK